MSENNIQPGYYDASEAENQYDVIDVVKLFNLNFNTGNALKYIVRNGKKASENPIEGIDKAIEYLIREREYLLETTYYPQKEDNNVIEISEEEFLAREEAVASDQDITANVEVLPEQDTVIPPANLKISVTELITLLLKANEFAVKTGSTDAGAIMQMLHDGYINIFNQIRGSNLDPTIGGNSVEHLLDFIVEE